MIMKVLKCVEDNEGDISTRQIEESIGIDQTAASRTLKRPQEFSFDLMERANINSE